MSSAAASQKDNQRDFAFSDSDFRFIAQMLKERAGIVLADHKRDMVYSRLAKRIRELKMESFREYIELLTGPKGDDEIGTTLNALTTNLTKFFREPHHFDHLKSVVAPAARSAAKSGQRPRLRIWSAGCSSGEEPYSIAMTLLQGISDIAKWDAKILATDIDTNMVHRASQGIYERRSVEAIPGQARNQFAKPLKDDDGRFQMSERVRSLITFKPLNLLHPWPMKGPFDLIFCRNVVIYFDKDTQRKLFDRYADLLRDDSFLYIGHSESLFNVTDRFKLVGQSIYQKQS